ncbi:hypothetical protein FRC08_007813 [Ceratobasidium sp. 394]|nr:hypothetical protein FRC08_007813 [Ceratobasidium sp. 394]
MVTLDDPDILMQEEELDEEDGSVGSQSWVMEVVEEPEPRFIPRGIPVNKSYGKPCLDGLPTIVLLKIVAQIGLGDTVAFRRTCRALNKFISETDEVWQTHVKQLRQAKKVLIGRGPVVLPRIQDPAFQEELLRCAFLLHDNWSNPAFQLEPISTLSSSWSTQGVEQILFVPDSMGRYFLTVSRGEVYLWTLQPHSSPRICRKLFPWATAVLNNRERIINVLVSRPSGQHSKNTIPYVAIQFSVKDSCRLRTEIHRIHLTDSGLEPQEQGFGLCCVHMAEGALVAFTDFVLAYALGDAAQTILLCCWVTRQAKRLVKPVPEWEIPWQHHSCRAVMIGVEIIVVVRDSTAEVYPREAFTPIDDQQPRLLDQTIIEGELELLPTTYATDTVTFPCSFTSPTKIHIHRPQAAKSFSEGSRVDLCVQPISIIGVARPLMPPMEPGVPYYVATARLFRTPMPQSSGMVTPSVSNPPSPSHTAPPSPLHTAPYGAPMPAPLPAPERYKFVFHVHALQSQHPYPSYGPILAGPNGRGVMLGTSMGGGEPQQFVAKFTHPSNEELRAMVWPDSNLRSVPPMMRMPQTNAHLLPQPHPQPQAQSALLPIPLQILPPMHPHPPVGPMMHPAPPLHDPFAPLGALMCPTRQLDVMHGLSYLWTTNVSVGYDLLAWDESAGSLILGTKHGNLAILECAFRGPPPRVHTGRALA